MGIEPTPSAWKAEVLPLNYTRLVPACADSSADRIRLIDPSFRDWTPLNRLNRNR